MKLLAILEYRASGSIAEAARIVSKPVSTVRAFLVAQGEHHPKLLEECAAIPWSEDENWLIERYYPLMGARGMLDEGKLTGRTRLAIVKRAATLGLSYDEAQSHALGSAWTTQEVALLGGLLNEEGRLQDVQAALSTLPGRTLTAIEQKVRALMMPAPKIKRSAPRKWQDSEDALLMEHYSQQGSKWVSAKLGRSVAAVTNRAYDLGVTCQR